jgi:hypothetical protein
MKIGVFLMFRISKRPAPTKEPSSKRRSIHMKKALHVSTLIIAALFTVVMAAHAAAPRKINYQGYLTNPAGSPLTGTYNMVFSLYDAATAGTQLWTETRSVSVDKGIFNVALGAVTTISLAFDVPYYLDIRVGGEQMTARQPLTSVGYAFSADRAASADSASVADSVPALTSHQADTANPHHVTADQVGAYMGANFIDGDQKILLTSSYSIIRSVTVNAPADGVIIVNASGGLYGYESNSSIRFNPPWGCPRDDTVGIGRCGVIKETSVEFSSDIFAHLILVNLNSTCTEKTLDSYRHFSTTRGFSVAAGPHTFNLYCDNPYSSSAQVSVADSTMTAIFVPNRY